MFTSLIQPCDNQPDWVIREEGLESYKEFNLGQKIKRGYVIHIQKVGQDVFFRVQLASSASITILYDNLKNK